MEKRSQKLGASLRVFDHIPWTMTAAQGHLEAVREKCLEDKRQYVENILSILGDFVSLQFGFCSSLNNTPPLKGHVYLSTWMLRT